jgi:hypothetical protein
MRSRIFIVGQIRGKFIRTAVDEILRRSANEILKNLSAFDGPYDNVVQGLGVSIFGFRRIRC